jgi:uncharacterized protein (DUF58 family)
MRRTNQFSVTREGWYYLFVLAFTVSGAVLREINLLLALAGMMIGIFVYNWWKVITALYLLQVNRRIPERICAGDLLVVDLELTNHRTRGDSWSIVVEDQIQIRETAAGEVPRQIEVLAPRLGARKTARLSYRGRLMQRGHYVLGPIRLSTRFPLGLLQRACTYDVVNRLVVCPRLGLLTNQWLRLVQSDRVGSRQTRHRQGWMEGDFHSLRDWRSGDSRRWIHWRSSAKRRVLQVRQFERQKNQRLALLLDLWQPSPADSQYEEICENAICFAATAIEELCRRGGSELFFGIAGDTVTQLRGAASMGLLFEVMDQLARVQGTSEDQLPELLDASLGRIPYDAKVIVLSSRSTELNDPQRFRAVWDNPHKRNVLRKIICIDVSSDKVSEYFRPDQTVQYLQEQSTTP